MRPVTKGEPAPELEDRRRAHLAEIAAGTATSQAWRQFNNKTGTRQRCLNEQFGLCAFSEVALDGADLGMHLDHVKPRSKAPDNTFLHANLLLSAIDDIGQRGLNRADVFGGHARGNRYSARGFIQPLMTDSRRYFHYRSDGVVEPRAGLSASDCRRARYSMALMNLNAPILVNRRRRVFELLEDTIAGLDADRPALERLAEQLLCPDDQGRLPAFHSGVRQRLGLLGEAVLTRACPACA